MSIKKLVPHIFQRFFENFLSVKVWFIIWPFVVSTIILDRLTDIAFSTTKDVLGNINNHALIVTSVDNLLKFMKDIFNSWLTFNVSLVGSIVVVREIFKIPKINGKSEEEQDQ